MNTDTTTESTPVATAPKLQQTATITLTANGATMTVVAERKGTGARTYVITTDADKKSARGMSEPHATFDAAKAGIEKMAKAAEKLGWQRKDKARGFAPKADAFTTMPAPPAAPKAAKK